MYQLESYANFLLSLLLASVVCLWSEPVALSAVHPLVDRTTPQSLAFRAHRGWSTEIFLELDGWIDMRGTGSIGVRRGNAW
jgi:hypothetical protein